MLPLFPSPAGLVFAFLIALLCIVIHERAIVVPVSILGHGYLVKVLRRRFGEMGDDVRVAFGSPFSTSTCGEHDGVAHDRVQVHGWVAERKELVPGFHSREPWFLLSCCCPPKEALHRMIQAEEYFLHVNGVELRVVFPARAQRLLCLTPAGPSLPVP